MDEFVNELFELADELEATASQADVPEIQSRLSKLEDAATKVGKAWSGSWLGYHSRVYYEGLTPAPPGARFSQEWGLQGTDKWLRETVGDWVEYSYDEVYDAILSLAGNPDLGEAKEYAKKARRVFEDKHQELVSILTTVLNEGDDAFISKLKDEAEGKKVFYAKDFVEYFRPTGQFMSRDTVVFTQGVQTPAHIAVLAEVMEIRHAPKACQELGKVARRAASHLAKQKRRRNRDQEVGTNVFIGHGRSGAWRDLKDFIQDRLGLPWDEFNRVPVAGITNIARLSQMLDDAAIAFLVLTAEDEQADGKMHARMNVIHEAGLFQGKLGFTKAIILMEDGCEEFSNIQGLGQIRFPVGRISAIFEEIRRVLEREDLVQS